jgi:hypothetical protein
MRRQHEQYADTAPPVEYVKALMVRMRIAPGCKSFRLHQEQQGGRLKILRAGVRLTLAVLRAFARGKSELERALVPEH